jgi:hypothetical protein
MDMVEEHYHLMNLQPELEGIDREDSGMGEDMMVEVEVVGREPDGMVLVRHWTGEASATSLEVGGACEIGVFKRSTHICKSGLQLLFAMT